MAATRIACPYAATQRERKWRRAGRGLAFLLRRRRKYERAKQPEQNNEIIPRGGARARVFEVKPSPFFDIFVGFGEKAGKGEASSDGFLA